MDDNLKGILIGIALENRFSVMEKGLKLKENRFGSVNTVVCTHNKELSYKEISEKGLPKADTPHYLISLENLEVGYGSKYYLKIKVGLCSECNTLYFGIPS